MPLRDLSIGLGVIVIWALNIIVIKVGVADMPPLLLTTLRFALVALLLVPFHPVARHQLPFLALLSLTFGTLHFALLFIGLGQAEAGTGALLLTSALGWAISQLLIKRGPNVPPLALAGWVALFAIPQVALGSWWLERDQLAALGDAGWIGWGAVFYTAVMSSIVAYGAWYGLLRRHPVNRVVPLTLLVPVLAVGLGVLLLGDSLGPHKLIGGGLVIVGIGLIVLRFRKRGGTPRRAS
ncbi:EamA family transporter [Halomonas elongata]|uniref:DMT family transporter n=1 Tax=Halomonas elongata TaxID=2746 RepID=UPI000DCE8286|nr:EamA family transporter [Halomonas elongata]RAW08546.1 EamA family transporter [Halomonas elongata]